MPTALAHSFADTFKQHGHHTAHDVLPPSAVRDGLHALTEHQNSAAARSRRGATYAMRNLLAEIPFIRQLANSGPLRALVEPILGEAAFPVRGILFDKLPEANWAVPWHQDCAIAVQEKSEVAGFGPWSIKAGVTHVEPPVSVLESMMTLRIHLDDCDETNGPLRVITGSHQHGKLNDQAIARWSRQHEAVTCCVASGGVVMMRPLLLHASSQVMTASTHQHRRVVHIEYANIELPGGLRWFER